MVLTQQHIGAAADWVMAPTRTEGRWALALVAAGAVAIGVLAFALTQGLTFYADEWAFLESVLKD